MDRKMFRSHFNFEIIAKLFFDLAEERYPSSDKILQLTGRLVDPVTTDPLDSLYIKIALLNTMRTMVKEVAPGKLYRTIQHRDDLFQALIEALEDLEDELQDLEEKLEEEEEDDETE